MNILRRTVILISAMLIFFGSGGWVLTDHFCREEINSCSSNVEMEESCCCGDDEMTAENVVRDKTPGDLESCCYDQSSYFSMPLYRLEVSRFEKADLNPVTIELPIFSELTFATEPVVTFLHKPPPLVTGGIDHLLNTGILRI